MSWGNPDNFSERMLTTALRPASAVYALGSYLRLLAYGAGYLKREELSVPVISIGNLTCGGTGKTPVTIDLARRLIGAGHKVAILSRGYRRKSREELLVVSDGQDHLAACADAGDEPYMMARAVPQAVVIVSARRAVAAEVAIRVYDANVILLDDGFQHFAIARDQDVVLIDYADDPVADSLLPAGRLREPVSALSRADWIVITKIPLEPDNMKLLRLEGAVAERAPAARISRCRFNPRRVRAFGSSDVNLSPAALSGVKVVALSGIARPQSFVELVTGLKAEIVRQRSFADHHWWCRSDIDMLRSDLRETGAELVVTTEKDAVRLDPDLCQGLPISVVELEAEWLGPVPVLDALPPAAGESGRAAASLIHKEGVNAR